MDRLKLNKNTNTYEASITISVDAEIFRLAFNRYVEENKIDLSDAGEVQMAMIEVGRIARWLDHPRTEKIISSEPETRREPIAKEVPYSALPSLPSKREPRKRVLSLKEERELIEQARRTPESEWINLLAQTIPGGDATNKAIYRKRDAQKNILKKLAVSLDDQPASRERLQAIADLLSANKLR